MEALKSFRIPLSCGFGSSSPALTVVLYLGSVIMLVTTLARTHRFARSLRFPALLVDCIVSGLLLYTAMLIPGALGVLMPVPVFATLVGLTMALNTFLASVPAPSLPSPERRLKTATSFDEWPRPRQAALVIALLATAPLLYFLAASPFVLVSRGWPLAWDTVSYHLPGLVEYLQHCSLWVIDQPFQSYSSGFELIGGFPAVFFPSHWGLVAAHVYAVVFLVAAITCLAAGVRQLMGDVTGDSFPLLVLLSLALWCLVFREQLWAFGKNDIFQAACVLSMLGLLLDGAHEDAAASRFRLLLAAAALALAIATKPTSFAYVPVFVGLCFSRLPPSGRLTWPAVRVGGALLGALSLGGFFYARNLVTFGHFVDPRLVAASINTSIVGNLRNPRLYVPNVDSIVFVLASCLPPLLFVSRRSFAAAGTRSNALILVALHVTGVAALLVTPWLVFQPEGVWHLRLAMPFFSFVAIACSVAMIRWLDTLHGRVHVNGVPLLLLAASLAFLPWWWHDRTPRGLPGFERVHGQPETGIYRWVQRLDEPVRIYSAGIFPYGLYGAGWANRLVYDLSSAGLDTDAGRLRILSILETFRPDLIVIAADPFTPSAAWSKPSIIAWLRQQPEVVEVYCDETVSAFEVLRGRRHLPPDLAACRGRTSSNASWPAAASQTSSRLERDDDRV